MKFSIPVSNIRKMVSLVRDVVPARSVSQEGTGILMEAFKDKVVFSAVGSDIIIRVVDKESKIEEEGKAVVSSSIFSSIVSSFTPLDEHKVGTGSVIVSSNFRNKVLTITSKTYYKNGKTADHKRSIPLLNADLFQAIPRYNSDLSVPFPGITLIDSVNRASYAASMNTDAGVLCGISMCSSDGNFTCVATDGVKLAEYTSKVDDKLDFKCIIPTKFATKIVKSVDPLSEVRILPEKQIFWVSSPGVLIGGFTFRGDYPNYKPFLNKPNKKIIVDKKMFLDNVKNLDFGDTDDMSVKLKFCNGNLNLVTVFAENEGIEVDYMGEFEIDFSIKFLKSSLQSIDGTNLHMEFSDNSGAAYFYSPDAMDDKTEFKSVLMPLNK